MSAYFGSSCRRLFNVGWFQDSGHTVTLQDDEILHSNFPNGGAKVDMYNQYTAPYVSEGVMVFRAHVRMDRTGLVDLNMDIRTTHTMRYIPSTIAPIVRNVTSTTATLGGTITKYGNTTTGTGIVYSSSNTNPTLGGSNVIVLGGGNASNVYLKNATGLTPNTTYYMRGYALGTSKAGAKTQDHGEIRSFTTLRLPTTELRITSSARTAINYGVSASVSPNQRDETIARNYIIHKKIVSLYTSN